MGEVQRVKHLKDRVKNVTVRIIRMKEVIRGGAREGGN